MHLKLIILRLIDIPAQQRQPPGVQPVSAVFAPEVPSVEKQIFLTKLQQGHKGNQTNTCKASITGSSFRFVLSNKK